MAEPQSPLREFRHLEEKLRTVGLSPAEQGRWESLRALVAPAREPGRNTAAGGFDVEAAAQALRASLLSGGLPAKAEAEPSPHLVEQTGLADEGLAPATSSGAPPEGEPNRQELSREAGAGAQPGELADAGVQWEAGPVGPEDIGVDPQPGDFRVAWQEADESAGFGTAEPLPRDPASPGGAAWGTEVEPPAGAGFGASAASEATLPADPSLADGGWDPRSLAAEMAQGWEPAEPAGGQAPFGPTSELGKDFAPGDPAELLPGPAEFSPSDAVESREEGDRGGDRATPHQAAELAGAGTPEALRDGEIESRSREEAQGLVFAPDVPAAGTSFGSATEELSEELSIEEFSPGNANGEPAWQPYEPAAPFAGEAADQPIELPLEESPPGTELYEPESPAADIGAPSAGGERGHEPILDGLSMVPDAIGGPGPDVGGMDAGAATPVPPADPTSEGLELAIASDFLPLAGDAPPGVEPLEGPLAADEAVPEVATEDVEEIVEMLPGEAEAAAPLGAGEVHPPPADRFFEVSLPEHPAFAASPFPNPETFGQEDLSLDLADAEVVSLEEIAITPPPPQAEALAPPLPLPGPTSMVIEGPIEAELLSVAPAPPQAQAPEEIESPPPAAEEPPPVMPLTGLREFASPAVSPGEPAGGDDHRPEVFPAPAEEEPAPQPAVGIDPVPEQSPSAPLADWAELGSPEPAPQEAIGAAFVTGEHRVVVHTVGGQVLRGTVRDVDLLSPSLALWQAEGREVDVAANHVKAVFFMLGPGEPPSPCFGTRVRVTFGDGRQVAGMSPDYLPTAPGFFVVPVDTRTNTGRIWVYRDAARQISVG